MVFWSDPAAPHESVKIVVWVMASELILPLLPGMVYGNVALSGLALILQPVMGPVIVHSSVVVSVLFTRVGFAEKLTRVVVGGTGGSSGIHEKPFHE